MTSPPQKRTVVTKAVKAVGGAAVSDGAVEA